MAYEKIYHKAYSTDEGMWAGELAGSVTAHYLHHWKQRKESKKPGVFFSCSFGDRGIAKFLHSFTGEEKEDIDKKSRKNAKNEYKVDEYKLKVEFLHLS